MSLGLPPSTTAASGHAEGPYAALMGAAAAPPSRRQGQAWMTSFTDLVALMLTFFVLLFAMSTVEQQRWQNLTDALADNLDAVREAPVTPSGEQLGIESVRTLAGTDLDYLAALLNQNMAADLTLRRGVLHRLEDRLVIALPADLIFASGSSELAAPGRRALVALGGLLRRVSNRVEVTGHADPRQPAGGLVSNWDLSLARALSVAALLRRTGIRGPLVARGFGDARFDALSDRIDPARRLALGRRVELVVHAHSGELP